MLWQIYKYTQTVGEPTGPSLQQSGHDAQQPKISDDGLEEVEPELYEKPATLKLDNWADYTALGTTNKLNAVKIVQPSLFFDVCGVPDFPLSIAYI